VSGTRSNLTQAVSALNAGDTVKCIFVIDNKDNNARMLYAGLAGDLNTVNAVGKNTEYATWGNQASKNCTMDAFSTTNIGLASVKLYRTLENA